MDNPGPTQTLRATDERHRPAPCSANRMVLDRNLLLDYTRVISEGSTY